LSDYINDFIGFDPIDIELGGFGISILFGLNYG
jgi:hypothetical protein